MSAAFAAFPLQALQAAQIVYQHAPGLQLQGEALTILARAHHALGRMQEAFTFYQQVCMSSAHSFRCLFWPARMF